MIRKPYRFYRMGHLALSLIACLLSLWAQDLSRVLTAALGVVGCVVGYWLGRLFWRRTAARIDPRNIVILYFEDTGFYGLMIPLFILQAYPRLLLRLGKVAWTDPELIVAAWWLVLAMWFGHNVAFYLGIRTHELAHGNLGIRRFYARSVIGSEGMISREGAVLKACNPTGTVKIDATIWKAESIDSRPLSPGQKVKVRDIEGLKLFVESLAPQPED